MDNMHSFIDRLNFAIAQRERETGLRILKKDLAAAAGVTSSAVTLWFKGVEDGGTNELKASSIHGLAKYLKVRAEWLRDKDGPMRATGAPTQTAQEAPAHELPDNLSREAKRLVYLIVEADREKTVSRETLNALTLLFNQSVARPTAPIDLTTARSIARAEELVAGHQPKRRQGKGAA
jgi:transcriptional regulator with XRE-family HTH domain